MRTDEYVQAARELFVPETNAPRFTISSAKSSTKARIRSAGGTVFIFEPLRLQRPVSLQLRGEFNVPFGRYKKPYFPEASCITSLKKRRMPFSIVSLTR